MAYLFSVINGLHFFLFSLFIQRKKFFNKEEANKIFFEILNTEKANGMNPEAYENATKEFNLRYQKINWTSYCDSSHFVIAVTLFITGHQSLMS